jgi:hypothetical protein
MFISLIDLETDCIVHFDNSSCEEDPEFKFVSNITFENARSLFELVKFFNSIFVFPQIMSSADVSPRSFEESKFVILDEEDLEKEIQTVFGFSSKKQLNVFERFLESRTKENVSEKSIDNILNGLAKITDFMVVTKSVDFLESLVDDCDDCDDCSSCECDSDCNDGSDNCSGDCKTCPNKSQEAPYFCEDCKKDMEQKQIKNKKLLN